MTRVTIHKAKTELSKLIAKVEAGEEVVICRGDKEVARLISAAPAPAKRRVPGRLKGLLQVGEEAAEPLTPEEIAVWEDGPIFPTEGD